MLFKRYRERRKEITDFLLNQEKELRNKRIEERGKILNKIIEVQKDNPCIHETYNIEKLSEFVSDQNKSLGMKRIIAILVTMGYLLTTMIVIGLALFPIKFLFQSYMVLAFVATAVIMSYFYTSYKLGNMFKFF